MVIVMDGSVALQIHVEALTSNMSGFGYRAFEEVIKIK